MDQQQKSITSDMDPQTSIPVQPDNEAAATAGTHGGEAVIHAAADGTPNPFSEAASTEQVQQQADSSKPDDEENELWEWIKAIAVAIVLVIIVQTFLISPFIVSGSSMEPNFHDRQRMIVNKLIYQFRTPERGEVVVFLHSDGRDFIKRIIGLPGDKVRVEGDQLFLNGEPVKEPYLEEIYQMRHENDEMWNIKDLLQDYVVPEGHVFVMGDNRSDSLDSRDIGPVKIDQVVGRSDLIYWPLSEIHFVQHPPLEPIKK